MAEEEDGESIKLLLIFACPPGCSQLRLQSEERIIRECFKKSIKSFIKIKLDVLPACTNEDLSSHLLQRRNEYNIIHYSGHCDRVSLLIKHLYTKIITEYGPLEEASSNVLIKELEVTADQLVQKMELHHHAKCTLLQMKPHDAAVTTSNINRTGNSQSDTICTTLTHFPSIQFPTNSTILSNSQILRFEDLHSITSSSSCTQGDIWSTQSNSNYHGSFAHSRTSLLLPSLNTPQSPSKRRSTQFNLGSRMVKVKLKSGFEVQVPLDSFQFSRRELIQIGVGSLVFESAKGNPSFVHPSIFADLLLQHQSQSLECVILNACGSRIQGDYLKDFSPFTVCFEGKIADDESLGFSRGFYQALCEGLSFEECFKHGQSHMKLASREPVSSPLLPSSKGLINLLCSEKFSTPSSSEAPSPARRPDPVTIGLKQRIAYLESTNATLTQENERLKDMMSYGVEAMRRKDEEIDQLKQQLTVLLPQYMSQKGSISDECGTFTDVLDNSVTDNATSDSSSSASLNGSSACSLEPWLAQRRLQLQKPNCTSKTNSPVSPKKVSRKGLVVNSKMKSARRVGSVPQSPVVINKKSSSAKLIPEVTTHAESCVADTTVSDDNRHISQLERLSSFVFQSGHRLSILPSSFYGQSTSLKPQSRIEELDELANQFVDVTISMDPPTPAPSPMVSPRRSQNLTIRPRKSPATLQQANSFYIPPETRSEIHSDIQSQVLDENKQPQDQTGIPNYHNTAVEAIEVPVSTPKVSFSLSQPVAPSPNTYTSSLKTATEHSGYSNRNQKADNLVKVRSTRVTGSLTSSQTPFRITKSASPFASSVPRFQS